MPSGKVYLVGAGPGDPGIFPVRGLELLKSAEVVVYDRLVNPALLEEAPGAALRIFAGKATGWHSLPQDEINRLLIAHPREGRRVVRLKGGDPFVLGRGGAEAEAPAEARERLASMPGLLSRIRVPSLTGAQLQPL